MKNLIDEFDEFTNDNSLDYYKYHNSRISEDACDYLKKFLTASMDEIRLRYAEKFSECVLDITGAHPMKFFRTAVLRKELFSDIDYDLQRDHSAHTLHNFLLGWYQ